MKAEVKYEKRSHFGREIIETVLLTLLLFLAINLAVQNYDVEGRSMEPRLHNQERLMVDKVSYLLHAPERGDVVVFVAPPEPSDYFVKRIIGLPGDVISIHGTTVVLDGVTLNETYVKPENQGNPTNRTIDNLVVPANSYFVMGDNRAESSDSRSWGFVPRKNIVGRAALVYWPLGEDNNGLLADYSSVFANVHQSGQGRASTPVEATMPVSFMLLAALPALVVVCSWYRSRHPHREHK